MSLLANWHSETGNNLSFIIENVITYSFCNAKSYASCFGMGLPNLNQVQWSETSVFQFELFALLAPYLKANMKSYIPLETAAIFFSCEPISKTGYWLGVSYGWFHLHRLTRASRSENWELQKLMKNSYPYRDSNSRPLLFKFSALSIRPFSLI